jgi:tetratricopeptide (TPR) repeat protein
MKNKIVIAAIFLGLAITSIAQGPRYAESMKKNIETLDQKPSIENYQNAANNFERIANAEKNQWLPFYYAGYATVMQAFSGMEPGNMSAALDKAESFLYQAAALEPDNSEIAAVMSMVITGRMQVDGSQSMTLGPKATALLSKAMSQQPQGNPRVMMNLSQNLYYTPEPFGGSKKKALELMEKALQAYDTFNPASELHPNWGKVYIESVLKQWKG